MWLKLRLLCVDFSLTLKVLFGKERIFSKFGILNPTPIIIMDYHSFFNIFRYCANPLESFLGYSGKDFCGSRHVLCISLFNFSMSDNSQNCIREVGDFFLLLDLNC